MKRLVLLSAFALLAATAAFAQQVKTAPVYWVVETNRKQDTGSIVRFYDANNALVHEITYDHIYIDINKRKHKRRLNQLLKRYNDHIQVALKKNRSKHSI